MLTIANLHMTFAINELNGYIMSASFNLSNSPNLLSLSIYLSIDLSIHLFYPSIYQPIHISIDLYFYGPPDDCQRAICFCLVRPSVFPSMGVIFFVFWSKSTFYGVLRRFGVFLTFSIFVHACVRALRSMY